MAMEYTVQRLQIGDVILDHFDDAQQNVEATVVRDVERTEETVRVTLRVEGRDDFVEEWPLGKMVTVVRGP
jgi:hypothetical protein